MAARLAISLLKTPVSCPSAGQSNVHLIRSSAYGPSHGLPLIPHQISSLLQARRICFRRGAGAGRQLGIACEVSSSAEAVTESAAETEPEDVPLPVVILDQHSEPEATVLELQFGDRLGALLDTTKALKELGLNVVRATVTTNASVGRNRFVITRSDTGQKVEDPSMLEAIRMTVLANLLQYHPESSERLALANVEGFPVPRKQVPQVETVVTVESLPDGKRSVLSVETADRPGLITDIVEVITGLSITVESAEIDTEGEVAKDQFYVSYHGKALNTSMKEVTVNCLRYYLTRPDIEIGEDSY